MMNKILIENNEISKIDGIKVSDKTITFINDGVYEIEYGDNLEYGYTFIVNASVKLYESSFDKKINVHNHYIVNDGTLDVVKFYNNKMVNEIIDIDLCNRNSSINYNFVNICKEDEYYEININHKYRETKSNINNKSIALKNSKLKFVINSRVDKDSVKSILDQNTRIVTMGDANASVSPNMFIDLEDVMAKHGSTIGTFKSDQVFYLMSKGISYNDALKLLIRGYLLGEFLDNYELRKKVIEIIDMYWR